MTYPPAPWTLKGSALLALRLVDVRRTRAFVPAPLQLLPVLPGKTLAIVYFGDYGPGSSLMYHELIIAPAVVRLGHHFGFWISHIYVDDPKSVAGGREIWGLPKEPARFDWDTRAGRVAAWQKNQLLCAFTSRSPAWGLPALSFLPLISLLDDQALAYSGRMTALMSLAGARVEIPAASPFESLRLSGPAMAFHFRRMSFYASRPRKIEKLGYH